MYRQHYEKYFEKQYELRSPVVDGERIREGEMVAREGDKVYRIDRYIPLFIEGSNYADNFGLQWNEFKSTQLDSKTGRRQSSERFWANTKWTKEEVVGKTILEVGSGAGRFTEVLLAAGANVVSVDYSNAVYANYANNYSEKLCLIRGNVYELPFERDSFDLVFCYGVLQHTPDPKKSLSEMFSFIKPGGKISVDNYIKSTLPSPWHQPKYIWRPVTTKMEPEKLLKIIKAYIPYYLSFDTLLKRLPLIGPMIAGCIPIPCWNYLDQGLSYEDRLEWAIMDTFDALGAMYDFPVSVEEMQEMCMDLEYSACEVFQGSNGVVVNMTRTIK